MNIQLMEGPAGMKSPANPNKMNVRQRVGQQRRGYVHEFIIIFKTSFIIVHVF